jgi:L-fuculose-phosphate aldolase
MNQEEKAARSWICEVGRRLYLRNYVAANDGNISVRLSDGTILATPTNVSKGYMDEDMLVKLNPDGSLISSGLKPSSEIKMHLRVYEQNSEVFGIVHAHPPVSTAFAIAGIKLDQPTSPEAVVNLGVIPIAPYATPGTEEVAESIAPFCKTHTAVLLANHGALTWGKDLSEAYFRMESLEHVANMTMLANFVIGRVNVLSQNQVDKLSTLRETMGLINATMPKGADVESNTKDFISLAELKQKGKLTITNQEKNEEKRKE